MTTQLSQIRWWRVTWIALTVYGASFLIVFLIVTAYALFLGFEARGAPDQTMIEAFANQYAPWLSPIMLIFFTFLGAIWLGSFVKIGLQLHGLVLGAFVSLVNILFAGIGGLSLVTLITTVLVIAAGWLGGRLARRS